MNLQVVTSSKQLKNSHFLSGKFRNDFCAYSRDYPPTFVHRKSFSGKKAISWMDVIQSEAAQFIIDGQPISKQSSPSAQISECIFTDQLAKN